MSGQSFDHIISLGAHCETTYHIRRRFGCTATQVFDWLVTPTIALVELLENNFREMFIGRNMRVIFDGDAVHCDRYGTVHFHDFLNAKPQGRYVQDMVLDDCARSQDKFGFLAQRFRALTGRVLFIRVDEGLVYQGSRNGDFDDTLFKRFKSAIKRLFPDVDYEVLLLRGSYRGEDPQLHFDVAEKYGETVWSGSDRGWDEMFDRRGIRWSGGRAATARET
jgi:hypothetical protein